MKTSTTRPSRSDPVYALSTFRIERATNAGPKDLFLRDTKLTGFGVRVSPRNTKSFFLGGLKYGAATPDSSDATLRTIVDAFLESKEPVLRARSIEDYRMVFYSRRRGELTVAPSDPSGPGWISQ
jgi:hypothetical protein